MSSYVRSCVYCGHPIRMVENYHGYWQPMDLDGSGRHQCGTSYYLETSRMGGASSSEHQPVTYLTDCWWCGAEVWYHSNGYGDHVLFDELGWPWEIHACWAEYAANSGRTSLPRGFTVPSRSWHSPAAYTPMATTPLGRPLQATGYIACGTMSGRRYYDQAFNLSEPYSRETPTWVRTPVVADERWLVMLPKPIADALPNGSLVTLDLNVLKRPAMVYVLPSKLYLHRLGQDPPHAEHMIHEGPWVCAHCGSSVGTDAQPNWGFQKDMRVVCAPCAHRHQPKTYSFR